jgi:hypothetical protein
MQMKFEMGESDIKALATKIQEGLNTEDYRVVFMPIVAAIKAWLAKRLLLKSRPKPAQLPGTSASAKTALAKTSRLV